MKIRGATLVELVVALAVSAIVATIAGILLFDGLETWRREADRDSALRRATLAADKLAEDLASQPDWQDRAAPLETFALDAAGQRVAFFITGKDGREIAVCWYLSGNFPNELRRSEVAADATAASLPGNAAALANASAFSAGGRTLEDYEAVSSVNCPGVASVRLVAPTDGVPGIVLRTVTTEGEKRLASGEAQKTLPERCAVEVSRPVARP
jgi:prepilin-type N-terminal cleavage/methylation domain-containing protein